MYPTTEVRWFAPGLIPEDTERWFDAMGAPVETAARTDRYLIPSADNEPGIKLREGHMEVKVRTAVLGVERFGSGVEGVVETFRKWSFALAPEAPQPDEGWVEVTKVRRVRTFVSANGAALETADEAVMADCDVELGEVQLSDQAWWTICIEAFGPDDAERLGNFRRTAAHVFVADPQVLHAAKCMGYVGWLRESAR